jgi:hypothetical protein
MTAAKGLELTAYEFAKGVHFQIQNGGFEQLCDNGYFDSAEQLDHACDGLEQLQDSDLASRVKLFWNHAFDQTIALYDDAQFSEDDDALGYELDAIDTQYYEQIGQALTNAFAAADAEAHQLRPNVWEQNADLLGTPEELEAISQAMA